MNRGQKAVAWSWDPAVGVVTARSATLGYVLEYALRYCTTIFFGFRESAERPRTTSSGTATLLEIDGRRFLVTNEHVLREYEKLEALGEANYFQVGREMFKPVERLIARSPARDLCTFNAEGLQLDDRHPSDPIPKLEFFQARQWPPAVPERDSTYVWAGFPKSLREIKGDTARNQGLTFTAPSVTRVEPQFLVANLHPDRSDWTVHSDEGRAASDAAFADLGGMSGGPVFVDRPGGIRPELVALIYEHQPLVNQIRMTRLDAMRADGTLFRPES